MKFGTAQTRDEDAALVRGAGLYASDRQPEGALWLHVLRSDVPSGRLLGIDTTEARTMPGVLRILTGADLEAAGLNPFQVRFRPQVPEFEPHPVFPLARDQIRYAGEPVAAIIAETRAEAQDAAEAILLDIDSTEAVIDARQAGEARPLWPTGNHIFTEERGDRAAFDTALARAAHVVRASLEISRVAAVTLEARNSIAIPEARGTLKVVTGTQAPHRVRSELAHVLGMPEAEIDVDASRVGGSFGMRNGCYPEDVLVALAARDLGRPVRWAASRSDAFLSDTQSRPQSVDVTLALDEDLRFIALGLDGYAPVGAYVGAMSLHPMTASLPGLAGVYRTPVIHTVMRGMHVNTMHMAPYRGAGRPEAIYVIERVVDIAAQRLGVDRIDLRRRNMITPDQMPHATPLGYLYDSGDFPRALDTALAAAEADGFAARRAEAEARGKLRGLGIACAIESAGAAFGPTQAPEFGRLDVSPDGTLTIAAGSGDAGQGHATALAQIAERVLGWTGKVIVHKGDTTQVPKGVGTFGSRTMGAVGAALNAAAEKIIAEARPDAADALEVAAGDLVFTDGAFRVAGTDLSIDIETLSRKRQKTYGDEAFTHADAGTFPNGAHVAEVEIDPDTGALELVRYTVADDVGNVVNPLLLAGQIHGGVAQGLGQAFLEQVVYDPDGNLLTGSLMDYAVPRAADMAAITIRSAHTETRANPLGVKGVGESGTVGALPAGISAVHDALAQFGVEDIQMPATPLRIWQAIQDAKARGSAE